MAENPSNPIIRNRVLAFLAEFGIIPTRSDTANWGIERWIKSVASPEKRVERAEAYKAEAVRLAGARIRVPWHKCAGTVQYLRLRSPQSLAYERNHSLDNRSPFAVQVTWDHGVNGQASVYDLTIEEGGK